MEQDTGVSHEITSSYPIERERRCPVLQIPQWTGFSMFIRHCICYTPETFSIQNELCQQAEAYLHASNPRNAIDSGLKALNATSVSPDHDIATPLLHAYFDTWERVYCVVHKDTFWKEYYDTCIGIRRMSLGFRVLALAMMVLGQRSIDHDMPSQNQDHSERLSSWIECVEHYCYLLIDNQRLDLLSLQTICLFALYKGTTADRKEARTWIQRLAKIAVHARLHRDPSDLDAMSDFDKQLRRRLWASIVEIDIQVALEQGTSIPWVQNVDYDVDVYLGGRHTSRPTHLWPGCELQNALYESAKDRIAFLHATVDGTFCEKNAEDSARTLSRTLGTLDSICVSFSMVNSAPEPRILLRLHVLRPLLKAMQIIIFQLNNSDQIRETMTIYHKHALEFLRLYLKLSTSSRNGSLLSSTLFEVLSPIMQLYADGRRLASVPYPPKTILMFVQSWAKFEFDDLDRLSDRAIREQLMFFLLSQYLKSRGSRSRAPQLPYEMGSWKYRKLCSALAQRRRAPIFYLEVAEMAWA